MQCPLGKTAHQHVLGTGSRIAKILLIGEGPGRSENVLGIPFVGKAGKLLDRMLEESKVFRSRVFITNLVACRPCDGIRAENRQPTEKEVYACQPRLIQLLSLLKPKVVVLVGKVAQHYGHQLLRQLRWKGTIVYMTHPAAFLRQGGASAPGYAKAVATLKELRHG